MNEFLVLVPTTQKLVGITDIVEENKGVLPVVCVTNELKSLPISNEYKNFVQNPTGIIENFTNISSYRIDLTDEINTGNSWQLSFAIAHLLHHKNLLIFSKSKKNLGDTKNIIWSTGRLNKNLDLIDVDHITSKLEISLPYLKEAIQKKVNVNICVSPNNYNEAFLFLNKNGLLKDIKFIKLDNLNNLSKFINIDLIPKINHYKKNNLIKLLKIFFILLFSVFLIFSGFQIISNIKNYNEMVGKDNFLIEINKDRNSTNFFKSFAAFLFSYIQNFERLSKSDFLKVNFISNFSFNDDGKNTCNFSKKDNKFSLESHCNYYIEITNVSDKKLYLWIYKKNKSTVGDLPLEKSILASEEKLILENANETLNRLILVFSDKSNNEIEDKLNNIRLYEENVKIESQFERFSNLGFGFKGYDFSENINIMELK